MTNKTVIRKQPEAGKFTTIHNSILLDTRLSSTAFRLLTMILSDSDTKFKLSQTLYCKRLDITKPTFFSAIDNLEETGYLKKTEIDPEKTKRKLYSYTISEFGNLKPKEKVTEKATEQPIEKNKITQESTDFQNEEITQPIVSNEVIQESSQPQLEIDKDLNIYLSSIVGLLECNEISDSINDMIKEKSSVEKIKKWVEKYLICIYNENLEYATNNEKHPKAFAEYKNWLKTNIFKNHILDFNAKSMWAILRVSKYGKKYTTDFETQMGDYYENPRD